MALKYLRLVRPPPAPMSPDDACLDAFQREVDYIHRTLRRLGVGPSEVEDLTQEVFLALHRSWGEYDPARPLRPYLFGISFRIASAHRRKRRREVVLEVVDVCDPAPGPSDALVVKHARAIILAALERIPLPRRAVLVMHELDDVPVAEVASVLGVPRFTVYSRLRKGRKELEAIVRRMTGEARAR
jgi:RNA polymerase sigma-70 factor (ECF subfamily)